MGTTCSRLLPPPVRTTQASSNEIESAVEQWNARRNPRDSAQGIYVLAVLSTQDDARAALFETPGVIDALVAAARKGETSDIKENAIIALANLADDSDEKRVQLFGWKGVVETMLECAWKGKTNRLKVNALRGLVSLAYVDEHKEMILLEWNDIVDAFRDAALDGETPEIKGYGVTGVVNLVIAPTTQERLFEWPGVVDALRIAATRGESEEIKEQGLNGLVVLAFSEKYQVTLFEWKGIVDIMLDAARCGATAETKVRGLVGLASLAGANENKLRLFEWDGLVELLLTAIRNGATDDIKYFASCALVALIGDLTCLVMFNRSDIVELLIELAMNGSTQDMRKVGLMGLYYFSDNMDLADRLLKEWNTLQWLKLMDSSFYAEVTGMYLNMAVSPKSRDLMIEDLTILTSIEDIIIRSANEKTRFMAKLCRAILRGSDAKYHSLDLLDFKSLTQVLEASLDDVEFLGMRWPILTPLVAIRYLATVDKHRDMLGNEILPTLRRAVHTSMEQSNWYAAEMAITTIAQYALDRKTFAILAADPLYLKCLEHVVEGNIGEGPWSGAIRAAGVAICALQLWVNQEDLGVTQPRQGQVILSYASHHELAAGNVKHLGRDVAEFLLRKGFTPIWCDEKKTPTDVLQAIAASEMVVALLDKHYMESVSCKLKIQFALHASRRIIPMVVQPGYDHREDDWLGRAVSSLPFYDISSLPKKSAQLAMLYRNELDCWNGKADYQHAMTKKKHLAILQGPAIAPKVPRSVEDIEKWSAEVGIPQEATKAIIRGGYVTSELLEDLSTEPSSEIQKLLQLELPAHATKLRRELQRLFPNVPQTPQPAGSNLLMSHDSGVMRGVDPHL